MKMEFNWVILAQRPTAFSTAKNLQFYVKEGYVIDMLSNHQLLKKGISQQQLHFRNRETVTDRFVQRERH
jgi:hypothetical protein